MPPRVLDDHIDAVERKQDEHGKNVVQRPISTQPCSEITTNESRRHRSQRGQGQNVQRRFGICLALQEHLQHEGLPESDHQIAEEADGDDLQKE